MAKRNYYVVRWKNDARTLPWRDMAHALAKEARARGRRDVVVNEFTYDPDDPEDRWPPMCEWHVPHKGFVTNRELETDAKRRFAQKQKQKFCTECGHYLWTDQFGVRPADD